MIKISQDLWFKFDIPKELTLESIMEDPKTTLYIEVKMVMLRQLDRSNYYFLNTNL